MAAETMARAGLQVMIVDRMPSLGRKFLMAGKSGLNLTYDTDAAGVVDKVSHPALAAALQAFDPDAVREWASGLGQDLFTGSSGRVFPRAMKASPLLRAWLARLSELGVETRTRWRWTGWDGDAAVFETSQGPQSLRADVIVLAMGGASWRRLGSDGAWADQFAQAAPFAPSNAGLKVDWTDHMAPHFGTPLKSVCWSAGTATSRGEAIITRDGLEGGGIYTLTPQLRDGAPLVVDLVPDIASDTLIARAGDKPVTRVLRNTLRLPSVKIALFNEFSRGFAGPKEKLAGLKALPIRYADLAPLDAAISTAGGLRFDAVDDGLMLKDRPGVFCAGEMLDWEAPTGGYLITVCLASGRWAGLAAAAWCGRV